MALELPVRTAKYNDKMQLITFATHLHWEMWYGRHTTFYIRPIVMPSATAIRYELKEEIISTTHTRSHDIWFKNLNTYDSELNCGSHNLAISVAWLLRCVDGISFPISIFLYTSCERHTHTQTKLKSSKWMNDFDTKCAIILIAFFVQSAQFLKSHFHFELFFSLSRMEVVARYMLYIICGRYCTLDRWDN